MYCWVKNSPLGSKEAYDVLLFTLCKIKMSVDLERSSSGGFKCFRQLQSSSYVLNSSAVASDRRRVSSPVLVRGRSLPLHTNEQNSEA